MSMGSEGACGAGGAGGGGGDRGGRGGGVLLGLRLPMQERKLPILRSIRHLSVYKTNYTSDLTYRLFDCCC